MYRFFKSQTLPNVQTIRSLPKTQPICTLPKTIQRASFSSIPCHRISVTSQLSGKANQTSQPPKKQKKQKAMPPRPLWLIKEDEIEEKFIKGGGPGGQKINKSNIKVQITHKPTGLVVNSQDLRSQEKNRAKAREILALRLEQMQNPDTCRLNVLAEKIRTAKRNKAKKAAKKHKKKDDDEKFEALHPESELEQEFVPTEQQ